MLIEELLEAAVGKGASDIHISAGLPAVFRIDGKLVRTNMDALTAENVESVDVTNESSIETDTFVSNSISNSSTGSKVSID